MNNDDLTGDNLTIASGALVFLIISLIGLAFGEYAILFALAGLLAMAGVFVYGHRRG